jgi:hypothetical protein
MRTSGSHVFPRKEKDKEKIMADNKQIQQVHDASWDLVNSIRDSSQTVSNSVLTIQEANLKSAQNIFLTSMELVSQQTENVQRLQQQWGQQFQLQQEALQRLMTNSMQVYRDFLLLPFTLSRRAIDAAEEERQKQETT